MTNLSNQYIPKRMTHAVETKVRAAIVSALLVYSATVPGCKRASEPEAPPATTQKQIGSRLDDPDLRRVTGRKGMNVLFVDADTTRADHLGCYGHPVVKTPHIDRFAAQGILFKTCISSAPLTLVSHSTMMTGSYQYVHGARDNGMFSLAEPNVTLAEIFKEAGYQTAAEVATVILNPKYGLNQGFDHYGHVEEEVPKGRMLGAEDLRLDDSKDLQKDLPVAPALAELDRKAGDITDHGIAQLRAFKGSDKPFFMWLHYYDPHWPQEAPLEFAKQYTDPYFAEIAYFDDQFGRLISELDELGMGEDTLVIFTSDHGEGRGQHGEYTHSVFLYDSTLHVPLVMRCPGTIPAGLVVESQVRLVDLADTILEFVGLKAHRSAQMQGSSLLPFVADPGLKCDLTCYADTISPKTMYNYSPLRAIRTGDWKYILAPKSELYYVREDPLEVFNRNKADSDRAMALRQEMWDLIAGSPSPPGGTGAGVITTNPQDLEQLRALGYVASVTDLAGFADGNELDNFEPSGENPHDHIESIELLSSGLGALRFGRYEDAERELKRFILDNPENCLAISSLGNAFVWQKKWTEAETAFRECVRLEPEAPDELRKLGLVLFQLRKYGEAEKVFRSAAELKPDDAAIAFQLGVALGILQRYDESLAELDKAARLIPEDAPVYFQQGAVLVQKGETDQAIAAFKKALSIEPKMIRAHAAIAIALRDKKGVDVAIRYLDEALEKLPNEPILYFQKAVCLIAKGDLRGAGKLHEKIVELNPNSSDARIVLAGGLLAQGKRKEAIVELREGVKLGPDDHRAFLRLADALEADGQLEESLKVRLETITKWPDQCEAFRAASSLAARLKDEQKAIEILQKALATCDHDPHVLNDLAWRLATSKQSQLRDGSKAVELARKASVIAEDDNPIFLDTLSAAYAEIGDFDKAIDTAQRAQQMASEHGISNVDAETTAHIELYRKEQPVRE